MVFCSAAGTLLHGNKNGLPTRVQATRLKCPTVVHSNVPGITPFGIGFRRGGNEMGLHCLPAGYLEISHGSAKLSTVPVKLPSSDAP